MTPQVSILLITFNRLLYTKQAIESILQNTNIPYELIIADNKSSDNTRKYLASLPQKSKKFNNLTDIKLIFNKRNMGLAPALNQCLEESSADMICYAGQDITVPPKWLSTLYDAFGKFDQLGWLNPVVEGEIPRDIPFSAFTIDEYHYLRSDSGGIAGANGITHKKILQQVGGFSSFPNVIYKYGGVDGYTLHKIRQKGKLVCWLKDVVVTHLERNDRERYKDYVKWKFAIQDKIRRADLDDEEYLDFDWQKQKGVRPEIDANRFLRPGRDRPAPFSVEFDGQVSLEKGKVGNSKLTIAMPWNQEKLYMANDYFEAISRIKVPKNTEYFILIDTAYVERKSFEIQDNTREERRKRVGMVHDMCRQRAIENKSNYLMIVEADLLAPSDSFVRMLQLFKHKADIGAISYTWHGYLANSLAMSWSKTEAAVAYNVPTLLGQKYPLQVAATGFGCICFTRRVLENVKFRYLPDSFWSSDGVLGMDAERLGYKILVDNRLLVYHFCCQQCYGQFRGKQTGVETDILKIIQKYLGDKNYCIKLLG